jgi:hypothetical protein
MFFVSIYKNVFSKMFMVVLQEFTEAESNVADLVAEYQQYQNLGVEPAEEDCEEDEPAGEAEVGGSEDGGSVHSSVHG